MRYLFTILFLWVFAGYGQHLYKNRYATGPGEYYNFLIDSTTKRGYILVDKPTHPSSLPDSCIYAAGGAHHGGWITSSNGGEVWMTGDNGSGELGDGTTNSTSNAVKITTDSLGNPFNNVVKLLCGGTGANSPWGSSALKRDGTVWVWGSTAGGLRGNGTMSLNSEAHRPVQVPFPAGTVIVDVCISFCGIALDTAGQIWTWGANYSGYEALAARGPSPAKLSPATITLPVGRRAVMISGGGSLQQYALLDNGSLLGWTTISSKYLGTVAQFDMSHTSYQPWLLDSIITSKLPAAIDTVVVNSQFSYVICKDSTLWGWGDNVQGNAGDGTEIDMRHYTGAAGYTPYAWDQGALERMQLIKQIMPGKHNFTKIFGSSVLCWYAQAEDVHDSLYFWGRNKGGIGGNLVSNIDSVQGDLPSAYPNSWDVLWPTCINPLSGAKIARTTCPLCKDSAGALFCSTYPWDGSKAAPTVTVTSPITVSGIPIINATISIASGVSGIRTITVNQVSGQTLQIPLHANVPSYGLGGTAGNTVVVSVTAEDTNFKTTTQQITINIGCSNCYTKPRGVRHRWFNL